MDDFIPIKPLTAPPKATIELPGSKSITNRALLCAALASGTTEIRGALFADDTEAMLDAIACLGSDVSTDPAAKQITIEGLDGTIKPKPKTMIDARMSGTTSRFLVAVAATTAIPITIDGHLQLRSRPFSDIVDALRSLSVVVDTAPHNSLPLRVQGPLRSGQVTVSVDRSSQFLSGLMLAAPLVPGGLIFHLDTTPVSRPYIEMTAQVMRAFAAEVEIGQNSIRVAGGGYKSPGDYVVEPDASAASYFWAAAAITGGSIQLANLYMNSIQGDIAFASVLKKMGASVMTNACNSSSQQNITVTGGHLRGINVGLTDLSDTVPTLAVVAAFAEGSTTVEGVGFIRDKESDRITASVEELRRCGVAAYEHVDGFTVSPTPGQCPTGARINTYNDHRMAMAFSVLGLVVPGIEIENPGCVAKTFPDFFSTLEKLYIE
ncbi:MAG: 3-phosphoshikimate 1-carboxyvinyltransferase [Acidimicrobiaceae bacterium]|nr:3-phosphoshikimate 1-carboxyvinyltransferase [Acidimicrobiaceae bacterium]